MIPRMGHFARDPGGRRIGQGVVNGTLTNGLDKTDHGVSLSLVEWVDGEQALDVIIGTDDEGRQRKHCLWLSAKSVWDGVN